MPSPITPDKFKAAIPGTSSSLCDKFTAFLQLPFLLWQKISYERNEDGSLTDAFKAEICAASVLCGGGNGGGTTPNPNMPAPTGVQASDGTYADRIKVTWFSVIAPTGIAAPTEYQIYRAPSTTVNPNNAVLVGTVPASGPNEFYDLVDGDLSVGSVYNYWLRASNGVDVSGFSGLDYGNALSVVTTLTAVSDLACTKGFAYDANAFVSLVWTPTGGATKWDIYRNTVNDAGTAVAIATNQIPASTAEFGPPTTRFFDNDGELMYQDDVPIPTTVYYYWVVGKKDAPPAQSPKSNVDSGWLQANISPYGDAFQLVRNAELLVPVGITTVHCVLFGGKAGGGGGGIVYGSGGGGGGATIIGDLAVIAGAKIRVVSIPNSEDTGETPHQTSGAAGYVVKLQYSANGTYSDVVDVALTVAPLGGAYSGTGPGAGGAAGGGSASGLTNVAVIPGRAGGAANAGNGGKSGYLFGGRRLPMNNRLFVGDISVGSGSKASGNGATVSVYKGGPNATGYAVVAY